ncbi:hypothetical protein KSP40_PGU006705 [Platanthera guangdongensis]|uniref:Uncharacterized protein n=1 Tax=Platanthera guangdongensis TaxID=2320717 RepID=A0ABR2MEW1_9ASPA
MGGGSSTLFCCSCSRSTSADWDEDDGQEWRRPTKVGPSDDGRNLWMGEPDIDQKASDFISKFYETRYTDNGRIIVS